METCVTGVEWTGEGDGIALFFSDVIFDVVVVVGGVMIVSLEVGVMILLNDGAGTLTGFGFLTRLASNSFLISATAETFLNSTHVIFALQS